MEGDWEGRFEYANSQSISLENFIMCCRHCSIYIILMDHDGGIETPRRDSADPRLWLRNTGTRGQR